ncbi:MAG: permease prefix domain 1-containing protein [Treponema sp.]|nr:permease prefix domain 1-containing protein [Treponema sp.]
MNSKIKNYVEVLFTDIPSTRKSQELKEEILSNLNEHFEEHLREGKSENQAYTEALGDLGDIDELLKDLAPEQEIKEKLDVYRKRRARNTSIAVMLYIAGAIALIAPAGIASVFQLGNEDKFGIIGFIVLLVFVAIATGILIYTKMSVPQDVEPFLKQKPNEPVIDTSTKKGRFLAAFMKLYWTLITIIYLVVSFTTGEWGLTWLIWLIASAIKHAIFLIADVEER